MCRASSEPDGVPLLTAKSGEQKHGKGYYFSYGSHGFATRAQRYPEYNCRTLPFGAVNHVEKAAASAALVIEKEPRPLMNCALGSVLFAGKKNFVFA